MYLPPISHSVTAAAATNTSVRSVDVVNSRPPPSPPPNSKLRLLCSYGGRITPRPNNRSLFYAGGETRVVAVDRHTTASSLSAFTAHLSRSYNINRPFIIKYLLPSEDLDALISVTNDEDLENMIEEHDRLASFPQTSRIRLFLFPQKTSLIGSEILEPKPESWLCDAFRSPKMTGLDNSDSSMEPSRVDYSNNSSDLKQGFDLTSAPESIVLDTSSSFGSSSSSVSMSNLGLIGAHGDDAGVNLPEKKVKIPSQSSVDSDASTTTSALPFLQTAIYQDQIPSNIMEQESFIVHDPPPFAGAYMPKHVNLPPYTSLQPDHSQFHQEPQYIQLPPHFIPQYPPPTSQPISSFYPVYYSPIPQQPNLPFHPNGSNPPYPLYILPAKPTQTGNVSVPYNMAAPHSAIVPPPLDQDPPQPLEDLLANPVVDSTSKSTCESGDAYNLIYKTQPSTPPLAMYYEAGKAGATKP